MEQKKGLRTADFDMFAEKFDKTRTCLWKEALDFLDSVPKGSLVLDVGTGGGRHALYASKTHKVVALDISRKMIQILREKDRGMSLVIADAAHLPFKESAFSAVIYVAAIHHIETEEGRIMSLAEVKRVLFGNGRFIASAWAREQEKLSELADEKGDLRYTWDKKFPRFYHLFCEGEFSRISEGAGFRDAKEWRSGDNWWLLGKKARLL